MTTNVGTPDRVFRIALGIVLLSLLYFLEGNARWFGLIGVIPLATAIFRWCPAYSLFGWSSASAK